MNNIKPYTKYKPSGIAWLGDIPEHWEIKRIKYIFKEQDKRSETGLENLLSVSHYTGVTKKSDKVASGEMMTNAATLVGYKIVEKGDLVINIMLARNGSLGISKFEGITSPAYCVYKSLIGGERYFGYLFRTKNAQQEFKKQSTGIIDSRLRLYSDKFFNIRTAIPTIEEQTTIAAFLDYKTAKIDRFIFKKKQLIKLLNEQKAGIINDAVTGKMS
jgi:type I restriction enzyme S subunit